MVSSSGDCVGAVVIGKWPKPECGYQMQNQDLSGGPADDAMHREKGQAARCRLGLGLDLEPQDMAPHKSSAKA